MKLLMENWRQYVAEVEQEEPQQLDEGIVDNLKKLGMAAAATVGLGVGTAQAAGISGVDVFDDAGSTIAQIDLNSQQVGEFAEKIKAGKGGNKLKGYGSALERMAQADGDYKYDSLQDYDALLANALSWYATGIHDRQQSETPTASSESDASAPQTTVTQRQEIRNPQAAAQQAAMNLYVGILQDKPNKKAKGLAALQMLQADYGIEIALEFQDLENLTKDQAKALVTSLAN
jgi:hypothetical protein